MPAEKLQPSLAVLVTTATQDSVWQMTCRSHNPQGFFSSLGHVSPHPPLRLLKLSPQRLNLTIQSRDISVGCTPIGKGL